LTSEKFGNDLYMQQENKTLWYDNLRVIATLGVIGIHVSSDYAPTSGSISDYTFWVGNTFDSLSRFAVPVFVMLSGALLLSKEYSIGVFLKKRLFRLILPFVFWSTVYIANSLIIDFESGLRPGFADIARNVFIQFRDGSSIHLWYIYMIIGLYLFIPIIGKWVRNATEKEMLYFLGIWLVVMIIDQPVIDKIKPEIDLRYFSGYLGYLVLGHYLKIKSFRTQNRTNLIALTLIATGLLSTILGTFLVHHYTNEYVSTFYEPLSPNMLMFAGGLFLWFKNKDISFGPLIAIRNFISKYSYGIFLVHVLVLSKLGNFNICWNFINPLFGIPVTVVICLTISAGIIFIVNKLPLGKYISG
jgi:surface polysaccharide O-acyltransferase-like enzyme